MLCTAEKFERGNRAEVNILEDPEFSEFHTITVSLQYVCELMCCIFLLAVCPHITFFI